MALKSLTNQSTDLSNYEIIVVDNRSTDNTKNVVEEFGNFPNIHYHYEPIQGLSHARNVGYQKSNLDLVAYLDDDAIASEKWVETIIKTFFNNESTLAVIGGQVDLLWEEEKPYWVSDYMLPWLGYLDLGEMKYLNPKEQAVYGCNMAFRKKYLESTGGFDTALGIQGKKTFTNEEVELQNRISSVGGRILYIPEMHIYHHAKNALTPKWFFNRAFLHGISVRKSTESKKGSIARHIYQLLLTYKSIVKLRIKKLLKRIDERQFTLEMVSLFYELGYRKESLCK